jgi:hypothetical protein
MTTLSQAAIPNLRSAARGLPQHAEATSAADAWPKILPANVATLNALYRHRRTIEALVAGHTVAIETAPRAAVDQDAFSFRLSFSGRPAFLRLSASLVDLCARSLAVAGFNRLGGVRAAMLLELALLRPIKALEGRLRMDIRVEERVDALDRWERLVPLHLVVRGLPAGDAAIELLLDHQIAAVVVGALDDWLSPMPCPRNSCFRCGSAWMASISRLPSCAGYGRATSFSPIGMRGGREQWSPSLGNT